MAMLIVAAAVSVLYGSSASGLLASGAAAREVKAVALARSRLAAMQPREALRPGVTEGRADEQILWRVEVAPVAVAAPGGVAVQRPLVLYDVAVTVTWPASHGRRRSMTLRTRRAG